jgi:hypothetical protein
VLQWKPKSLIRNTLLQYIVTTSSSTEAESDSVDEETYVDRLRPMLLPSCDRCVVLAHHWTMPTLKH